MDRDKGKNLMFYLTASPLKQHLVTLSVDEDVTRNGFPDEVIRHVGKKATIPQIKLQKKGTVEVVTLAISQVGTWDDLLKAIEHHFPPPGAEPQITSFDGSLITSPEDYKVNLRPGLHLIIYFPPTVDELSQSLDTLFFENISSTYSSFKLSSNPNFIHTALAPTPIPSQLAHYLKPPAPTPKSAIEPIKYHLQPPTIHFTVSAPTPISIMLTNSAFKNIAFYPIEKYKCLGDLNLPELSGNYRGIPHESESPSTDYTILKESSGLPTKSSDGRNLPPWSPFQIYNRAGQETEEQERETISSPYRVVPGGLFPMTPFDLFAQSQRRRVMCSIGWDVFACPMEGLKDIVSETTMSNISWAVKDDEVNERGHTKTSEKRLYGNYEGPISPENDNRDGKDVGWWMIGPKKLPTGFSGEAGEHTFLLGSVAEVGAHLEAFMKRCGVEEDVIEGFTNYWTWNLELSGPEVQTRLHDDFANALPAFKHTSSTSSPKLILLKFLHPRDLRNLLPLSITPEPHRIVRLFAVFRVIEQEELNAEEINPCGDFETEVDRVLGGIGSCGGGWNCGHRGFKVTEVGGVRVFRNNDGNLRGNME